MDIKPESLLGDLVAEDHRLAAILSQYGIDYCCHGNRTLAAACDKQGISITEIVEKLNGTAEDLNTSDSGLQNRFTSWSLPLLVDYIFENHHQYTKAAMPAIRAGLEKLVRVHGERHPELSEICASFIEVSEDLKQHLWKEENVLFPYIKAVLGSGKMPWQEVPFKSVETPISALKTEHEREGNRLFALRELTNNYTAPADGCNTYRNTFLQLAELDKDLIQHIHLENNIIFPRALVETAKPR